MVTAYGRAEVVEQAHSAGIDITLGKPVNPSQLHDAALLALQGDVNTGGSTREGLSVSEGVDLSSVMGAHILLVEDNALNQQVAMELLGDVGFRVDLAENGQIGVDKVGQTDYDLVLMDMQMPVLDGLQATLEIRSDERFGNLPIVAMTANAMAVDKERCIAAGMNDHVAKPIDPEALFKTLLEWIPAGEYEPVVTEGELLELEPEQNVSETSTATDDVVSALSAIEGLDVENGLKRVIGKRDFYEKLVRGFATGEEVRTVETVRLLLAEGDIEAAERTAHSLKGVAGTIGAGELQSRAAVLETAIKEGQSGEIEIH